MNEMQTYNANGTEHVFPIWPFDFWHLYSTYRVQSFQMAINWIYWKLVVFRAERTTHSPCHLALNRFSMQIKTSTYDSVFLVFGIWNTGVSLWIVNIAKCTIKIKTKDTKTNTTIHSKKCFNSKFAIELKSQQDFQTARKLNSKSLNTSCLLVDEQI